ncbi:sarcosine/dimethylglycine N-methyltransferase-like isoform X1 [Styela clava]
MGVIIAVFVGWLLQYLSSKQIVVAAFLLATTLLVLFRMNCFHGFLQRNLAPHFRKPGTGFFGFLCRQFLKGNRPLEETAFRSLDAQPHHKILEIGFGYGHGISYALDNGMRDGSGVVYGMDFSAEACDHVRKLLINDLKSGKLEIIFGDVANIPLKESTIDRVFHTNCYYFWPEPLNVCREILRVMTPGGIMTTGIEPEKVKRAALSGVIEPCQIDPDFYIECLVEAGFEHVRMEEASYQRNGHKVIFAQKKKV